jgi:predicted transglutaminase-like cysteine proteinase
MKNSNGLAGKAFTDGKIVVDSPAPGAKHEILISEEKDLQKLGLPEVKNALAIPVMDKQNGTTQAVLQVYNFDDAFYKNNLQDGAMLWDVANMLSAVMFAVDNL